MEEERIITFHINEKSELFGHRVINGYHETQRAIYDREPSIRTTQMCFLSTKLFDMDYRIFIYEEDEDDRQYEIKLGTDNKRTKREIKMSSNLLKLWKSGEFEL